MAEYQSMYMEWKKNTFLIISFMYDSCKLKLIESEQEQVSDCQEAWNAKGRIVADLEETGLGQGYRFIILIVAMVLLMDTHQNVLNCVF